MFTLRYRVALVLIGAVLCTAARATVNGDVTYPVDGTVAGDRVALRAKPDMTSDVIVYTYLDQKLRVIGEAADWYVVELPREYPLWVSKALVNVGADHEAEIKADRVYLRAGPGVQFNSEGQLNSGRRVEVLDEKDGWLKLRFKAGDRGYVTRRYVVLTGDTVPRPAPAPPTPEPPKPEPPKPEPPKPVPPVPEPPKPEPPKPEPVEEPEVEGDQAIMDAFNKAEALYKVEVKKDNIAEWDLEEASKLYVTVMEKTRNQSLLSRCRSRLAVVHMSRRYRDLSKTSDPRARLETRVGEIDREFARRRAALAEEIRELYPTCVAAGRVEKLATAWLQPATHKLIREDRVVYLLLSDTLDLSVYEDKFVGIEGDIDTSVRWPIQTLKVTGVVLPPEKK
jgi:SH3-like domain-containing protein